MILNNNLLQVFILLNNESPNNYLIGGCVRDYLMNKQPKDYDIVTDIHMDKLEEIFKNNGWDVDSVGKQFLVMFISKDKYQYEIANFRKDIGFSDGRRPDAVEIGDLNSDALRRDFTINSIYYNPMTNEYIDPNEGMEDLKKRKLKFVGNPKDRIKQDYLRVFRFYRFLTKGFKPDKRSLRACRTLFNEAYSKTCPERIREEIEKMVTNVTIW